MPEFLSFEEVVKLLDLSEAELQGLVSEGELRAFRDEDKMKFRKDDVESLAQQLYEKAPGVVLPGEKAPPADQSEGTILDLDAEQAPAASDTSVPTLDFGGDADTGPALQAPIDTTGVPEADFGATEGTIIEPPADEGDSTGATQEMVFEESDLKVQPGEESSSLGASEADETFAEDSSKMAAAEEGLSAETEGAASAAVEEEVAEEAPSARRGAPASAPAVPGHHPVMTACLFLCSVALWVLGYLLVDLVRVMMAEGAASPAPLCRRVIQIVEGKGDVSAR